MARDPRVHRRFQTTLVLAALSWLVLSAPREALAVCTVQFCQSCIADPTCDACQPGFQDVSGTACVDINECATSNGGCAVQAQCSNTQGSHVCTCNSGYTGSGTTCSDVNECATNNGGCSSSPPVTCTKLVGSFSCGACPSGYTGNGLTCTDVNECATSNGGCAVQAQCSNTAGSHTCTCNSGYTGNGTTCTDINECATSGGGCDSHATCTNQVGAPRVCTCFPGYGGDGVTCSRHQ